MYRTLLVATILTLGVVSGLPVANAGDGPIGDPECVQVYPYSQLCQGKVGEFACYYVAGLPPQVCDPVLR